MEPIKIVDKLTLRQEALGMAFQTLQWVDVSENIKDLVIKRAVDIAEYIQGSADLPEYVDENARHKEFTDALMKLQDNFKLNPWISVDSEMKPAKDANVLVMVSGMKEPMLAKYDETGWRVPNAPCNSELVAWMPIPPFTQPML